MNRGPIQAWLGATVVLAFIAGCWKPATPPVASGPSPDAAVEVATGEAAKIPEGFPKDVPLYEGLTLEAVNSLPAQDTHVIQGRTADPLDKVTDTVRKLALEQGWTEVAPAETEGIADMALLNYTKADRMLNVTLFREETGTSVNLTTGPQ